MTFPIARAVLASLSLAFGCGSAQHPAPLAPVSAGAAEPASPSTTDAAKEAAPKTDGDEAAKAKAADHAPGAPEKDAKPAASDEKDAKKVREVTFQMTPTGLVIEVDGVRMEP